MSAGAMEKNKTISEGDTGDFGSHWGRETKPYLMLSRNDTPWILVCKDSGSRVMESDNQMAWTQTRPGNFPPGGS